MNRATVSLLLAAIYLFGSSFLVLASTMRRSFVRVPDERPAISKIYEQDVRPTPWLPQQRFELVTIPAQFARHHAAEFIGDDFVPPAWGMFIMAVSIFLYLCCSPPGIVLRLW